MAGPRCAVETHHLKIDIDFDRILTITFPHTSWAISYMKNLQDRAYHGNSRARRDDDYTVSMKLPKNVDRMHIGLSTSAEEGGAVSLVFDNKQCASDWLDNSPLWERSRSSSPSAEMSSVIRTRWTHQDFENRMAMGSLGRRREPEARVTDLAGNPFVEHDVLDLENRRDHYQRRSPKKPFWKLG
jgi:hypothetical protein